MRKFWLILIASLLTAAALYYWKHREPAVIGGERDAHGCLTAAGYSFDATVGACLREFEMTAGIKQAAKLAVEKVGPSYALTLVSWNSYEEPGAYDITLESGVERTSRTIYIRGNTIVEKPNI